jgi:hypothetical protein
MSCGRVSVSTRLVEEALHIPGIGAAKVQRYAEPFLEAIRIWKQSRRR